MRNIFLFGACLIHLHLYESNSCDAMAKQTLYNLTAIKELIEDGIRRITPGD